ncbi:MAG: RHS repeat protein [Colwellia sp.]|nr:RHS repeat protein [Colwellia sp.]
MNFTNFKNTACRLSLVMFISICSLLGGTFPALAFEEISFESDYYNFLQRNKVNSDLAPLDVTLAGEQIDQYSGSLSFRTTDVSLAGNSAIPVAFTRVVSHGLEGQKQMGDWDIDIPRIEGRYGYGKEGPNCQDPMPETFYTGKYQTGFYPWDYHHGLSVHSGSGGGGKLITPSASSPSPYSLPAGARHLTKDNWILSCTGSGGKDFIARSPQGLKYTFNVVNRKEVHATKKGFAISRTEAVAKLVSKIEDRFGNYVEYKYTNGLLTSITSNKGRSIVLAYNTSGTFLGELSSVTANGKKWRYSYKTSTTGNHLERVTLPDGTFWLYDIAGFRGFYLNGESDYQGAYPELSINVTHPQGSMVNIVLRSIWKYKPGICWSPAKSLGTDPGNINQLCRSRVLAVVKKELTVNNGDSYEWLYEYGDDDHNVLLYNYNTKTWYNNIDEQTNTVTTPNAEHTYVFSRRKNWQEGALLRKDTRSLNGTLLSSSTTEWQATVDYGEGEDWDPAHAGNPGLDTYKRAEKTSVIIENNNTYTTRYTDFNQYGALLGSNSFNSFSSNTRYTKQTYQHDTSNWLLNLPRQKSISANGSNWKVHQENTYYSASGSYKSSPYESKIMGRVAVKNSQYHSDGNLKKVEYVGTGRYELFENYKRGKAQKITLPCQKVNGCNTANGSTSNTVIAKLIINNDGSTDRVTDFKGYATNYDYNTMGWLTKIDPVDNKWSNTNISYGVVTTANDGLSGSGAKVGQLKQTVSQGSSQKLTYFDSMLRPYLVRTRATNSANTTSYQRSEYDFENRTTFSSFPSSSITISSGIRSVFDALGRKTTDTRTTDNATTRYSYISNNRSTVTDPKGNATTTTYLAYGSPSKSKATYISTPKNTTVINYNVFGQVEDISQGGITEDRFYDNYQQLCKTVRPDTGVTAFGYNTARQMIWQAEGASGNKSSCDASKVTSTQKTSLTYNNWGEINVQNYPDGSPDKVFSYDENGQLEKLTAGSTVWNYQYNSLGLIEKETLSVGSKSFVIDPAYNSLGHVQSLTYPSGRVVDFAPNALGQATKAGIYAKSAKYHANGSLDSFTYGNQLTYKRSLNNEQQPYELTVKQGSSYKSRQRYLYDDNNNVDRIYDFTDRSYDINLGYDALDRLVTATGKWGSGSFNYDSLGNILKKTLGSQSLTYHYDTTKNRLNSVSGSLAKSFKYDARGNVVNNGYGLIFNRANQLTNAKGNVYTYDGHNRLVKKVSNGKTIYSVYGMSGTLFYREDSQQKKNDYIRLGSELVAKDNTPVSAAAPPSTTPIISGSFTKTDYRGSHFSVSWQSTGMSNITHFELYKSGDAAGPTPPPCKQLYCNQVNALPSNTIKISGEWVRAYSGSSLSTTILALSNTIDVKVRACNSYGCGPYSSIKSLSSAW